MFLVVQSYCKARCADFCQRAIQISIIIIIINRFNGENIRQIYDLMNHLTREKLSGMFLCIDFEKAFVLVDRKFMFTVLCVFSFGSDICQWISTFYKDIKSTVTVNGQFSPWFSVQSGCRQGDIISTYLFILCVEILANMIRQNENIKGIVIEKKMNQQISQCADDTEIMLESEGKYFQETVNIIEIFSESIGSLLECGGKKTQCHNYGLKVDKLLL